MRSEQYRDGVSPNKRNVVFEVLLVVFLGFGLFIYSSTVTFLAEQNTSTTAQEYNSFDFLFIVCYELVVLTIIAYYLKARQWSVKDFHLDFRISMVGIALMLVLLRESIGFVYYWICDQFSSIGSTNRPEISIHSGIVSTALILIVNSFYEEALLIGYFFKRFEKLHPALIIMFSFIVRASYHTYQGLDHLPMVLIISALFGWYYWKYKKLWPIIIAHGAGNLFHLLNHQYNWLNLH